jgi:hypothetical protein
MFFITSGKKVLPAAPSPAPRVTFSPAVRQGAGPVGEAADEDVEGDDGLVELPAEEVEAVEWPEPPPDVESDLLPQPPSSMTAERSTTAASEGFFTSQVSSRAGRIMRANARVGVGE